jgi:hypothetical protein
MDFVDNKGEITLYDGTGVSLTLNASAETLVGNPHNFHDKTHSIRIVSGTWKLYTDEYYRGREITYTSTTLTLPAEFIRIIKSVQQVLPEIVLYDESQFNGDTKYLHHSTPSLGDSFKVRSFEVKSGMWILWTKPYFRGCHSKKYVGPDNVSSICPDIFEVSSVKLLKWNSTVVNGCYMLPKSVL